MDEGFNKTKQKELLRPDRETQKKEDEKQTETDNRTT